MGRQKAPITLTELEPGCRVGQGFASKLEFSSLDQKDGRPVKLTLTLGQAKRLRDELTYSIAKAQEEEGH